jgi:hypothetical protein
MGGGLEVEDKLFEFGEFGGGEFGGGEFGNGGIGGDQRVEHAFSLVMPKAMLLRWRLSLERVGR